MQPSVVTQLEFGVGNSNDQGGQLECRNTDQ